MRNLDRTKRQEQFPEALRADGVAPEEQDAMWRLLDEWEPAEPSATFDDAVLARIREVECSGARRTVATDGTGIANAGSLGIIWLWLAGLGTPRGLATAGVLATLVIAMVMLRSPQPPTVDPAPATATMEISAQQVEMAIEDLQMLDELYSAPANEDKQNNKL